MMNQTGGLTAADVAAVTRNDGYGCNGNGMWGGDWLGYLLLFALFGGGYGGFGAFGGGGILPWLLFGNNGWGGNNCGAPCATQADVRAAVDQQTLISKLDGITNGMCDSTYALNNAINNGFYGVDRSLCGISREIADCCCKTNQNIGDLKYTVAQESCETRHAMSNNTRDIIDNQNANSRAILDFLVQDKMASKDARIAQLENRLSQAEQNSVFRAAIDASTAEIIRRTGNECPIPAFVVPNPNCCYGNPLGVGYNGYNGGCCNNGYNG